jgi:hypothetical protein
MKDLLETIAAIETQKKQSNIYPSHALFREVVAESALGTKETARQLNILYKQGKIKAGQTLNDKFITLIE